MEFETEADEPAALLKALTPSCQHPTATKILYRRDDGSFLAVCHVDGLTADIHTLPPGFRLVKGSKLVECYRYDKIQARIDMDQAVV
jgi:hypothetical protein